MILIRPAGRDDIAAVSALLRRTWHDTYDAILGTERVEAITREWHAPARLAEELSLSGRAFLVAEVQGEIAGTVSATDQGGRIVTLERLYIAPERQGTGLGRALFAAALRSFPEARIVRLEVEEHNVKACQFYEKLGLRPTGTRVDCGGLVLRPVRDGDAQDLFGLLALCFAEYPGCYLDPHDDLPDLVRPASTFADKGGAYWVVEDGDGRVGACIAVDFPASGQAELHRLYVRPDLRGGGLAKRLVALVEAYALAEGARRMVLWSDTRFTKAHGLYERLGYHRAPEVRLLSDISQSHEFFFEKSLA